MTNALKLTHIDSSKNSEHKNHTEVFFFEDKKCKLSGFVAIHNEKLGSTVGGTRVYPYKSKDEALTDVLRLSSAMTYKCAIAGIRQGGGKAVIIGDPKRVKTPALLKSYAKVIDTFKGRFHTGEDVGLSESDVQYLLRYSPYFIGKSDQAGDPSEYASLSVFTIMEEAVKKVLDKKTLEGVKVGVKGIGKVGYGLIKLLLKEKAVIIASDIDGDVCKNISIKHPEIKIVLPEKILNEPLDVYSPCAMGNEFNLTTIKKMPSIKIICGGANNQLSSSNISNELQKKGILYIPDYLANAGGLINVADELDVGGYKKNRVNKRIERLRSTFNKLYKYSLNNSISLNDAANQFAEAKFLRKK